jgi:hypothetical protein
MIAGVELVLKNPNAGVVDRVLKIKLVPRARYVEMAAKHFKLLTDVVQATNVDKLNAILEAGRQRHAKFIRVVPPATVVSGERSDAGTTGSPRRLRIG